MQQVLHQLNMLPEPVRAVLFVGLLLLALGVTALCIHRPWRR
jgi:hypothetical protein